MTPQQAAAQFLSDVYRGTGGEAVLISSVQPMRCWRVVPVSALYKTQIDFSRELFFSVSSYKTGAVQKTGQGRSKVNLQACGVLHFDFDKKKFDNAEDFFKSKGLPAPSYVFKRADRCHVYYLLDEPCRDFARIETVLKTLSRALGCDVLPAHPAALMRVPFTVHIKKEKKGPGYEPVSASRARYSLSSFETAGAASPHTGSDSIKTGQKTAPPLSGLENILLKERKKITQAGGRSDALYQFALRCRDFALEEPDTFKLAEKFNTLYCDPPEPENVVRHQTKSAYMYAKHPPGRYLSEKPEKVARKFEEDMRISESLQPFVFVAEAEILINVQTGLRYSKAAQIENALCYAAGVKTSLQYALTFRLITLKDRLAFRPGEPSEFSTASVSYYNTYDEVKAVERQKVRKTDAKVFETHLRYLTNSEQEFEHLRKFLACALLLPGQKIKHSLLLISTHEGIGKSVLQTLAEKILVSQRESSYVVSTSNTEIARGNNSWIESKFLTFVHELGQSEKFAVLDQIKNWITEPRVRISDKYIRSFEIENFCNFIFFSNAVNALPVSATDRRFFIVINRKPPQAPDYYEKLLEVFEHGLFSIVGYLRPWAAKLNINAPPPVTDSKIELRNYSRNELVLFLDECLHDPAFAEFFGAGFTIRMLAERTQDSARASNIRFSQKQAAMWLRENHFFVKDDYKGHTHRRLYVRSNVVRKVERFTKKKGGP